MKMRKPMIIAACLLPLAALAQPQAGSDEFGAQTDAWLNLQTSNSASVPSTPPLPGEVATRIYERYLRSFTYPIPVRLSSDAFNTSSSSGSGGASGGGGGSTGSGGTTP
jgi:uncharacterized membrane protein YgcG